MRELDLFLFVQGYAKYHQQRETVKFRAFFMSDGKGINISKLIK